MVNKDHVNQLLKKYFKISGKVEIQDDGSVNVEGNVKLIYNAPKGIIPVKFGIVSGTFNAERKGLVTLLNAPDTCDTLKVAVNKITSLEHAPSQVESLDVGFNQLTSLNHAPDGMWRMTAFNNPLTSLEGLPDALDKDVSIEITYDAQLPLLRLINVGRVHIGTPGESYMRLQSFEPVNSIINKYTGQGKPGAIKCAVELIKAGFKDNARW
jgi:hypothetical protein